MAESDPLVDKLTVENATLEIERLRAELHLRDSRLLAKDAALSEALAEIERLRIAWVRGEGPD
jgi:hypothetical protein